ncbi:aspartate aminotransferase family protein [Gammaproteobacteria bacterium]|nr:aspartate aminotransferase family protein [Gammaproteobacteria bacterium]
MDALLPTYARKAISFTHGEGAWLWDEQGERYLDALSGIAVCGLGHAHPAVATALSEQAQKLVHTSNIYRIQKQEQLGTRLCEISGMEKVFFCNSGAEANEAAIKLARMHGHRKGIQQPHTLVFENSFHGRTMATLTATGNRAAHAGFEPLVPGFIRAHYDNIGAIRQLCAQHKQLSAILVEPIQGEGGIHIPSPDFLPQLRAICDDYDLLLMIDEVQTGNGRTGTWYGYQQANILPDVMTTAKGLGNGVPIGACLTRTKANDLFKPGNHGSTFGGNPLACAAGLAVLDTIEQQQLLSHVTKTSELLLNTLKQRLSQHPLCHNIRGQGMMLGIELTQPCAEIVDIALEQKLLLNVTAGNVIRLLPPLIIDNEQVELIAEGVTRCVEIFAERQSN